MTDLEGNREYYYHDSNCSKTKFSVPNSKGLKQCFDCSGIFDENGEGVAITDKRFDGWRDGV